MQEAVRLCRLAADQRYPLAQFYLAYCFTNRKEVEHDEVEAAQLHRAAALQGHLLEQIFRGRVLHMRNRS